MRLITILAMMALHLRAQMQQIWKDCARIAGSCNRVPSEFAGANIVSILWAKQTEHWEIICQIVNFNNKLNAENITQSQCTSQKKIWVQSYKMPTTGKDDCTIWLFDSPHVTTKLQSC
ncbi:MAG: hypothetical protein ACI9RO_002011 [Alteromonas macleodii]